MRFLILSCFDPEDRQFRGISDICGRLDADADGRYLIWTPESQAVDASGSPALEWALISGHGAEDAARMGGGAAFTPSDLRLPAPADLYLLGCYQGRPELKALWAQGAGIPAAQVHGSPEDTETALSTLFLLNLAMAGWRDIAHWFRRWIDANAWFRPHFAEINASYDRNGGDFMATLNELGGAIDLEPFADFIAPGRSHAEYLTGLR